MWIVFEMEGNGLTDEPSKMVGPFETKEDAESYCAITGLDGVMEVEAPDQ